MKGLKTVANAYKTEGKEVPKYITQAMNTKLGTIGAEKKAEADLKASAKKEEPAGSIDQLSDIVDKWEEKGVNLYLFEQANDIHLDTMIVPKGERKGGIGSFIMQDLTQYADLVGKRVVLTPGIKDPYHGTTSRKRLVKFYKGFGFVENKGRNKDWSMTADKMYREPDKAKAEFSVKSYGEMDKGDKTAYNKQTKVMSNGDEVRKRINKRKGSAWAGTAIRSILTRQSFDDIIAGKPVTYDSPINEKKSARFKARLEKGGEAALWSYLMKSSFLGVAKKPVNCISGSFAECDPSPNCVNVCYAATGRRSAAIFLKAASKKPHEHDSVSEQATPFSGQMSSIGG